MNQGWKELLCLRDNRCPFEGNEATYGTEEESLKLEILSFQVQCCFNRKDLGQQARYIKGIQGEEQKIIFFFGDADSSKIVHPIMYCRY